MGDWQKVLPDLEARWNRKKNALQVRVAGAHQGYSVPMAICVGLVIRELRLHTQQEAKAAAASLPPSTPQAEGETSGETPHPACEDPPQAEPTVVLADPSLPAGGD